MPVEQLINADGQMREHLAGQTVRPINTPGALYDQHGHQQMYDMVHNDVNPAAVRQTGDDWVGFGNDLITFQEEISRAIGTEGGQWNGKAANGARDFSVGVGNWFGQTGSGALATGMALQKSSDAVANGQKKMPPVVQYDRAAFLARMNAAPPQDKQAIADEAQRVYNQANEQRLIAAGVMSGMDQQLTGTAMPTYTPPPTLNAPAGTSTPSGTGDGTGRPTTPGVRPGGGRPARSGDPTGGTGQQVAPPPPISGDAGRHDQPGRQPTPGPGFEPVPVPGGHGGITNPGQWTPVPTDAPGGVDRFGPTGGQGGGQGPGGMVPPVAGGYGGGYGPTGSDGGRGGTGGRAPGAGNAVGAGPRAGGMPGVDPHGGAGRAGGGARPGMAPGGMPLGAGAGRQGDDDKEHDRPSWLVDGDPDETWFGDDYPALPPTTIGED
ncbi:hypothetical protein [Herbihabitans rhizosphaerae]|uniref:hypothetical protein n=1 Tax=Herbihabitans rhizosphaerae TaxID=1872711 RepID=UPI00102ACBC5|nr:hypothetical protein [Herbihabitans rhizosphaerae]